MRWKPGRRGHYEVWYVAFNEPESLRGFWLRYTMRAPSDEAEPPYCQLWFMRNDRAKTPRNLALQQTLPIDALTAGRDPFWIEIADCRLSAAGCTGRVVGRDGEASWDLAFEPLLPAISPTPEWGARIATCYLEPHPLLRISGVVREGSDETHVDRWLGEQAHVFGVRHSRKWHWAECKHLGPTGRAFVGIAAWPTLPGAEMSTTSVFFDRGDGRRLLRNRALDLLRPKTAHSPDVWSFDAEYGRERLVGTIKPSRDDLIGVTYHDPGGDLVYCYHSELADIELRYYTRRRKSDDWKLQEEITAPHAAAFEYGTAEPLAGVPVLLD
jgi:hypothetical protein